MAEFPTIFRPPPDDPAKSQIENVLEVREVATLGPDIYTNSRVPWHPPGARGIYGGAVIAMCLAAGQRTVPDDFFVHSCHCYFILAGSSEMPILIHVERVRDGRSFATRTVQARQRGRCVFTVTMSFVREDSGGRAESQVRHARPMPPLGPQGDGGQDGRLPPPPDEWDDEPELANRRPFQSFRIQVLNKDSPHAHEKMTRQWVRSRDRISAEGGHQAHLNALAYISDNYFIGTISRIHRLWRYPFKVDDLATLDPGLREHIRMLNDFEGLGNDLTELRDRPEIGMMVSLDHTIYFHEPRKVRADEWMFTEMESPWAGDGRGVVTQRIFSKDGTLLATCFQEGIVRLKEQPAKEEEQSAKL